MVAHTREIDDPDIAVKEILEQLDLDSLLTETIGIIYSVNEFIYTGVLKAVCEALKFPTVGTSTLSAAVNDSDDPLILAVLVLTSDDVKFRLCHTDKIDGTEEQIRDAIARGTEGLSGLPALMLTVFPLLAKRSGDWVVQTYAKFLPEVPMFGTLAVCMEGVGFEFSYVVINGENHTDHSAAVLIYGDINPRFFIGTIAEDKFVKSKAVITKVKDGSIIQTVNDTNALDYLLNLGLTLSPEGKLLVPELFPLVIDYNDGTPPILRAMLANLPDGSIKLAGDVTEGSNISLSSIDPEAVRIATEKSLQALTESDLGSYDCVLLHSCAARYFVAMDLDPELELKAIRSSLNKTAKFIISYSAGEIYPTLINGSLTNRLHNYAFIICVF
jgi:hypothetical protein